MKKLLQITIICLSINLHAQTAKIEWYKDKTDDKIEILGNVNNETIGIIEDGENISFQKISSNGNVSKKTKLPYKFNKIDYTYINTILTKNSVIVLIKENKEKENIKNGEENRKKEEIEYKKKKIKEFDEKLKINNIRKKIGTKDKAKLKIFQDSIRESRLLKNEKNKEIILNKEKDVILAINIGVNFNVTNKPFKIKGITTKENIKKFGLYSFSNDSTKVLIYNQYHTNLNDQLKFSFTIIDENFTKKEKDTLFEVPMLIVDPIKNKFSKLYIDNNNNILGVFKEIRSIENNNSNFYFKALIFDNLTFKPRAFNVDYEGDIIDNLEIFPQDNNKFFAVGFLAGIKKGLKFQGKASVKKNEVFISEINTEQKTLTNIIKTNIDVLYPYNNLKISNYMPYKAEYININNNGDFEIIAHQINKKTKTNTINPGEEIDYDNKSIFYGDVSMIKINKKGILTYSTSISKFQSPQNLNPLMLYTYRKNNLITIFEDNQINIDVDTHIDPWMTIRNNENKNLDKALFITSVDDNRVLLKNIIYDYKKEPNRAIIKKSYKLNNNTFLLVGNNNIGKLTIE